MKHQPERTCIGCRGVFQKEEVVRLVAAPGGIVVDYREKLPGRAVYVCPRRQCIEKALTRDSLSRGLRTPVKPPALDDFIGRLTECIMAKIRSLMAMSAKAGELAAGYSAVQDALEKNRAALLVFAKDLSDGTHEKLERVRSGTLRVTTLFTREEMGLILNRELVGVVAILNKGFADAVWRESKRLKSLINSDR
jgi:predicted RNA-binding protein YlxR (DUF448 family)